MMESQHVGSKLWYQAYQSVFEMAVDIRGLEPEGHEQRSKALFSELYALFENTTNVEQRFLVFTGENLRVYFGFFLSEISIDTVKIIEAYLLSEKELHNRDGADVATNIEFLLITKVPKKGRATSDLEDHKPSYIPRNLRDARIPEASIRVLNVSKQMQVNVTKHVLQPKMRLITSEAEKERIRLHFIAQSSNKNQTLATMLPGISVEDPLSIWHGAIVGDVFYFLRSIGGESPYYRIVIPPVSD